MAPKAPWTKFKSCDIGLIIADRPELAKHVTSWELDEIDWELILIRRPQLVSFCPEGTFEPRYLKSALAAGFKYQHPAAVAIREARESLGITQGELARRLKTTQSVVSRTETGATEISLKRLIEYAHALGKRVKVDIS